MTDVVTLQLRQTLPAAGEGLTWRIGSITPAEEGIAVTVWIAKNAQLEKIARHVFAHKGKRLRIGISDPAAKTVDFAPSAPHQFSPQRLWMIATFAVPAALTIAAVLWLNLMASAIAQDLASLRVKIDRQTEEANRLAEHRSKREARSKQRTEQAEILARQRNLIAPLAALTQALPEDTYLSELIIDGQELSLSVFSARNVRDLLVDLQAQPIFGRVQLDGPILRDPQNGNNRFHLAVQLTEVEASIAQQAP